jgi:hypothetical protein
MLRSLRVANHRSLRDEQELLLMPQYDSERAAIPAAAIYGANASGKSNVIHALRFIQNTVQDSYQRWSPTSKIPRQPFRLSTEAGKEPSWYVLEMLIENIRWTYGFVIDDDRVLEEWLYSYPQSRKRIVFERDISGIRFGSTIANRRERTRVLVELTRPNALFLSLAAQVGLDEVMPVYNWLDRKLLFSAHDPAAGSDGLASYLIKNPFRRSEVQSLIEAADFGISGLDVETEKNADWPELESARLRLAHGADGTLLESHEESAGTRAWLALLPLVLDALSDGDVLVIDELDTSLHPRLAARVIELFRSPEVNTGSGQLIFTTHDATLLGTSLGAPVLARDEVWFVAKAADGSSSLFPLSDFKPRKGENAERRYLGGSYGAVPAVYSDSLVDGLLRTRGRSSAAS